VRFFGILGGAGMGKFIGIEIGNSAYTEFLMKNGEFKDTEDGIFLGDVEAEDEDSALEGLKGLDCNKERVFGRVLLFEVKG